MLYCENKVKFEKEIGYRTAGKKAPDDIAYFAEQYGAEIFNFKEVDLGGNKMLRMVKNTIVSTDNWSRLSNKVQDNDIVILQHPYEGLKLTKKSLDNIRKNKNVKFILFIHDLNSLRNDIEIEHSAKMKTLNSDAEISILSTVDYIICHNDKMKKYIHDVIGIDESKIVCLELFDYRHDCKLPEKRSFSKDVVIAGNLLKSKCGYLYNLFESNDFDFKLHLYGPNFDETYKNDNVVYHGLLSPDELPGKLEGAFGLVWDGLEIDSCSGNAGEYIKYNNPHKCSLFLASNMPVIIWKQAALASFVEENGVGITVDSLRDIGKQIDKISVSEYNTMVENTKKVGVKLREGYYFKKAVSKVLK